ncbi:transglycosylase domain-containing protein [Kutzneria buriramensis]|uniref:Membrane peptidoglycan carboxypeptidase n=1 Tax=Kutzneria buriramensis TaxID=1045776 RepID=A0A3E0HTR3_9PSEU|nr:transglycosylase domain-containing protein [Kutzneria buriramensis]REH49809.1 membrane peptidoglycan carboxypeptidase [Kutzneria buriramensis]
MGGRPPGPGQRGGGPNAPTQRTPFNQPTDMLPPVHEEYQREPELMTHREHDLPPGANDFIEPDEYLDNEYDEATLRKKRIWRRVRRTAYVLAAVGFVGPIVAFIITYFLVTPPDPQTALSQQQTMTIYYKDGSVMASLGPQSGGDRTYLTIDKIPKMVQHAVEAAEDETFETNSGFDIKGIGRAVLNQLRGNGGGGSGISQQYVKKATGNEDHTYSRKWVELVQSIKMNQVQSKDHIMESYLNIVYFGRGAYGIQAAAQAYFGKNVGDLNPSEAAFLAGCINVPSLNEDPAHTNDRWTYTMGRMVANGWISQADRAKYPQQPKPIPNNSDDGGALPGPTTFVVRQIIDEAGKQDFAGLDRPALQQEGAKIYTTIDKAAMDKAVTANQTVMAKDTPHNPSIASAQVSIDPQTGGIVAWYGGPDPKKFSYDMAVTPNQPGSSFKPFVFMAGMQNNPQIGLQSLYNGKGPQQFGQGQDKVTINNSDGEECPTEPCSVQTAMTLSINTVFYKMTDDVGPTNVRKAALAAGIAPTQTFGNQTVPSLQAIGSNGPADGIGIGQYEVRPLDMAQGYATLANNGMYIPAHFITKIDNSNGDTKYDAKANPKLTPTPAFDKANAQHNAQLARNVTESMLKVAGSSCADLAHTQCASLSGNRPVAAKTGTAGYIGPDGIDHNENGNAWMVGYTPQVVTAVWVGNNDHLGPIKGFYLNRIGSQTQNYNIFGREEPAYIWKMFMDAYLQGQPVVPFPTFTDLGGKGNFSGMTTTTTTTATTDATTTDTTTTNEDQPTTTTKHTKTTDPCIPGLNCTTTTTTTTDNGNGHGGGGGPGGGGVPTG